MGLGRVHPTRPRVSSTVLAFAVLTAAGCAASPDATSAAPSSALVLVSESASASPAPASEVKHMASPVVASTPTSYQPQVYVTAAQLLNSTDGAVVVKDCSAQGSCAFRVDVTSDGGATWRRGADVLVADAADNGWTSSEDPITGLAMLSASDIFVYGSSVWHTTDAGVTWTHLSDAPAVDDMAISNGEIWAMAACADLGGCASSIDVLSDGHLAPLPRQPGTSIGSIARAGKNAYAVLRDAGGVGELAVSRDDGTTWQLRALPQQYCTYSLGPGLAVTTTGVVYLVCAIGASAGSEQKDFYASDNGAINWRHQAVLEIDGYADAIVAASDDILWRYGGRAPIFLSTDAGTTWHDQLDDKVGDAADPMTQAFAASGKSALVFSFALPPSATFTGPWTIDEYRTSDAGASWQTVPLQP